MKKAVMGIVIMLVLLCAQGRADAYFKPPSLEPPSGPGIADILELEEAELESELLYDNSELSLESDLEKKVKRKASYALVRVKYTAYYGPKKGQREYMHGSYAKDVAVNGAGKVTAYGTKPRVGIVATDPKIFPKGTRFLLVNPLDGKEKVFIAEDKGGGIRNRHIDIFAGFGNDGLRKAKKIQGKGDYMIVKVILNKLSQS